MKFERIVLENFRQYFGRQRLDFSKDKQRKVTVIHGINGAGKTSLFLAINWCLYGNEAINNVGQLISKEAINRAGIGDYVNMSVELTFLHDGERYIVRRERRGIKTIDEDIQINGLDSFTMIRIHGDGQAEKINNPIGTINAILPANVRTYFLFDGEKIDDFAKPESAKQVKEAIYLVFKLETLERASRHLENAANDYRKELKNISSGELRRLVEKDDKARADLKDSTQRKEEVTLEIESVRRKVNDIDQQLREIQNARLIQQNRDSIERNLRQRRIELDEVISQIRDTATGAYFTLINDPIKNSLIILDSKREKGEIPSNIRQQFIYDLIAKMECICGRPFTEGSPEHQKLLSLIKTTFPDSLSDDIVELSATLRTFPQRSRQQKASIADLMRRWTGLVDTIKELDAELDDIGRQLKDSPLEEISRLEKQRQNFQADMNSYNIELGALNERIDKLNKEIAQLEKDFVKARKNEQKEKELTAKLYLAQTAADAIKREYQTYADDMRKQVEEKTKEIFRRLIWKDSHYPYVTISQDFNLEVYDRYSKPARPELSAGERQVLSLAFITAMSRISEEEAPLVMDTPFGRLSAQHRSNITENLPVLADQLILFVTDEELRDQARANIEPYIGSEYQLIFDPKDSYTTIRQI
jgi:DNA sulfur modification protein DndD